jgi:hypothetical protein
VHQLGHNGAIDAAVDAADNVALGCADLADTAKSVLLDGLQRLDEFPGY